MEYLGPLAAFLILLHQTGALLRISTSSSQRTNAGSDVLLHCTFSINGSSPDPRLLAITWFYQGKEIVKYQEKLEISHPRVSFDERAATSGNASILLSDVKIEDEGIYMCSVIYSQEKMEEEIILNVQVSPKIQIPDKAVLDDKEKTLVCSVSDFYPVDIGIAWLRDGEILRNSSLGKIQRNKNGAYSVDRTVTITPDHERKNQTFSCRVRHESLPVPLQEDFQLVYEVSPKIQILDNEKTLVCSVRDYYPVDIAIVWLRDGEILRNSSMGKIQRNINGTYSVDSTVTITPDHERKNQTFSCRVQHESLPVPLQEDFQLVYGVTVTVTVQAEETSAIPVIIGVCCAAMLLVAAVGIGLVFFKSRKKGGFTLSDIVAPDKLIDGEVVTLSCTGNHWPKKTRVIWLEEKAGGDPEIIQSHGGDPEEAERLLNTSYVIVTKHMGSQSWSSNLRFTFHMENHKGVTFICRFTSGKKTQEKRFHRNEVYAKPRLVDRVKPSLCVSREILYSLRLDGFYPRDIQIHWSCVTGEHQEIISPDEQLVEHSPFTFSVCSEARISEKVFTDPTCKVRVTWEHGSMDGPESTEMSILDPDFPWIPVVEAIQTPRLFLGSRVDLECKISEYFPDALTVNWLIIKDGSEEETSLPGNMFSMKSKRESDLTYSCSTILTDLPRLETHQGVEYICRVQHPSMKTYIEKRTGRLRVMAKPHLVEPIEMTLGDNSQVQFYLNLQSFYPEDIEITWEREDVKSKYELSPTNTVTHGKDQTFNVTSVYSVPGSVFNKPQNKVSVQWKHESLDVPEVRSWTWRDLPWRPVMEDIIIPELEAGKQTTLSCKISGYFPDSLIVQWIKKEKGNESEIKLPTRGYAIPYVKSNEEKDKTFTQVTRLIFTPHPEEDGGAEFICRVTHPTLEEPIERRTGPLLTEFMKKNQISDITTSQDGKFELKVDGFYPGDIEISWRQRPESSGDQWQTLNPCSGGIRRHTDGTCSMTSTCEYYGGKKDKEKYILMAIVEHKSLESPVEKTLLLERENGKLKPKRNISASCGKTEQKL